MNLEEKYKHALENFKKIKSANSDNKELVNFIEYEYPELKESEEEKIRKGLIKGLSAMRDIHKHQTFSDDAIDIDDAIAWLEKQGEKETLCDKCRKEQPSHSCQDITALGRCALEKQGEQKTAWSEEDEKIANAIYESIDFIALKTFGISEDRAVAWLRKDKNQEWGKDDEEKIKGLLSLLNISNSEYIKDITWTSKKELIRWLKSLKPNHWKPSEEQMKALDKAKNCPANYYDIRLGLQSLYNNLLKL